MQTQESQSQTQTKSVPEGLGISLAEMEQASQNIIDISTNVEDMSEQSFKIVSMRSTRGRPTHHWRIQVDGRATPVVLPTNIVAKVRQEFGDGVIISDGSTLIPDSSQLTLSVNSGSMTLQPKR